MPRSRRRPARPGALSDLSPTRILTQIALLQLSYYVGAAILILFVALVAGQQPGAGLILDWRNIRGDVTTGWTAALCWLLNAVVTYVLLSGSWHSRVCVLTAASRSVIPIMLLIARSKLVPDFALTIHLLHLIATTLYTRMIPFSLYWWLVQAFSSAIMVSLGVWACQWRELQPMAFGGKAKAAQGQVNGHATGPSEEPVPADDADEEETGEEFDIGQRRGRGRDGAGQYEMVRLPPKPEP